MKSFILILLLTCLVLAEDSKDSNSDLNKQLSDAKSEIISLRARVDWDTKQAQTLQGAISGCLGNAPQTLENTNKK